MSPKMAAMVAKLHISSPYTVGVSNMQAACGPQEHFVLPAMLSGNFKILTFVLFSLFTSV